MTRGTETPAWLLVDTLDQVGELIGIDVRPGLHPHRRPRRNLQPSTIRLVGEAFGLTLVAVAVVWAGWVLLWLVEQRW